jgi:hypothetical protein
MADADALHIGENSPEQVAFKLLYEIANVEGIEMRGLSGTKKTDRKWILDPTPNVSLLFARRKIATVGAVGRGGVVARQKTAPAGFPESPRG